jgi:hypothetical protein
VKSGKRRGNERRLKMHESKSFRTDYLLRFLQRDKQVKCDETQKSIPCFEADTVSMKDQYKKVSMRHASPFFKEE